VNDEPQPDLFGFPPRHPSGRVLEFHGPGEGPDSVCTCEHGVIGSGAVFDASRRYRFELWRRWSSGPFCMFVCLNPSTADETKNDPTVTRCINYAKAWGFGAFLMTNLFAFRATDPRVMKREADPVGVGNDDTLIRLAAKAGIVVAGWGAHGGHLGRSAEVRAMLPNLHALALTEKPRGTASVEPRHPLYLKADLKPFPLP
jgi:hypothetical protein